MVTGDWLRDVEFCYQVVGTDDHCSPDAVKPLQSSASFCTVALEKFKTPMDDFCRSVLSKHSGIGKCQVKQQIIIQMVYFTQSQYLYKCQGYHNSVKQWIFLTQQSVSSKQDTLNLALNISFTGITHKHSDG